MQPLVSPTRKPIKGAYRTATFFTFTSGNLTKNVTVPPGYYAAAYRFVRTATGQDTPLVQLPVMTVRLRGGERQDLEESGLRPPRPSRIAGEAPAQSVLSCPTEARSSVGPRG